MTKLNKKTKSPIKRLEDDLIKILHDVSGRNIDMDHHSLLDYGLSNVIAKKLFVSASSKLNVMLNFEEFRRNPTINNLVRLIRLSAAKEQILETKLKTSIIKPAPKKKYYPLSYAQKRMFVLCRLEPNSSFYNINHIRELTGHLDASALKRSIAALINRHESLRTNYCEINSSVNGMDQPVQIIHQKPTTGLNIVDLTQIKNITKRHREADRIIKENTNKPFRLESEPLLRAVLIKTDANEHILIIVLHHIVSDRWSMGIFWRELSKIYSADLKNKEAKLPLLIIQYKDYAVWEQSKESKRKLRRQEKHWLDRLKGELPALNLPVDKPRPPIQTYRGQIERIVLDKAIIRKLRKLIRDCDTTSFVFLLAAFNIFLHKLSGQDEIITGIIRANRDFIELENMIGVLHNNLPIRSRIDPCEPFSAFLNKVKEDTLSALDASDYPFEKMVEKFVKDRNMSRSPIFTTLFQEFHQFGLFGDNIGFQDIVFAPAQYTQRTTQFDLSASIIELPDKLIVSFNYATDLFFPQTIKNFLKYYKNLIESIIGDHRQKISELTMVSAADRKTLAHEFNDTKTDYPRNKTWHQLFEDWAKKIPRKTALIFNDKKLTYGQLNRQANQLAHYLKKEHKIKPESTVGIILDRSMDTIISILAVLKAGGVYLPINPEYPTERIEYILKDAGCRIALSAEQRNKKKISQIANRKSQIINLDNYEIFSNYPAANPINKVTSHNPCCIIYTSGSTGKPKGVILTHKGIINHAITKIRMIGINSEDIIAQNLSSSFVASVWQIAAPLITGGSVAVYSREVSQNLSVLLRNVCRDKATILSIIPQQLSEYLSAVSRGVDYFKKSKLKVLILTGERVSGALAKKYYKKHKIPLINAYGQAECSDDTLHYRIPRSINANNVPAGTPSNNTQTYILDKNMNLLPPGILGVLYIAGDGLAKGYLNDAKLTGEVFLSNPFIKGKRIYKTGDLARMHPDGNIEILGRVDRQIKIRGVRVEPSEIEVQINKFSGIKTSVVKLWQKDKKSEYLTAYYTADSKIDIKKLKDSLKKIMPVNLIPTYFVLLKSIPVTTSGKVDYERLPSPNEKDMKRQIFMAPRGSIEKILARIWQTALGAKEISRYDNFFDLGGNSLNMIAVHRRIDSLFARKISVAAMFSYPTIYELSNFIFNSDAEYHAGGKNSQNVKSSAKDLLNRVMAGNISFDKAAELIDKL